MNFLSAKPHPFLQTKGGNFGSDPQARKAVSVDYVTTTILDRGLTCGLQHKINTYYGSSIVVGLALFHLQNTSYQVVHHRECITLYAE